MNDRPAPTVRADAIANVTFERRDVSTMARFLDDFGFLPSRVDGERAHYFRGYGNTPYLVKIVPAARDAFVGFALVARHARDLEALANAEGKDIGSVDAPGGGSSVRLVDPDGNHVDLVHGFQVESTVATHTCPPPF